MGWVGRMLVGGVVRPCQTAPRHPAKSYGTLQTSPPECISHSGLSSQAKLSQGIPMLSNGSLEGERRTVCGSSTRQARRRARVYPLRGATHALSTPLLSRNRQQNVNTDLLSRPQTDSLELRLEGKGGGCRVSRTHLPQLRFETSSFRFQPITASPPILLYPRLFLLVRAGLSFDALLLAPRGNSSSRRSRLARTADGRPAAAARVDHLHLPSPALKEYVFSSCFPLPPSLGGTHADSLGLLWTALPQSSTLTTPP